MTVERYLARIGYDGPRDPTLAVLSELQRAHLLAVPFENLDIHLGRRLVLDPEANVRKLVDHRRGGWCFELNGSFAWLLERLGFDVTLLGSRVAGDDWVSMPLAHLLLRVDLEQPYLVDVGFGAGGSLEPLPLEQVPDRMVAHGDGMRVLFDLEPRRMQDFEQACHQLQTSPESSFVRTRVCSMMLPDGRLRLRELTLSEQRDGELHERELAGEDEWRSVLRRRFGVELPATA